MTERLSHVLKRIDSRHLAKLWSFYRDYFADDDSCLSFVYKALAKEPANDGTIYRELDKASGSFINDEGSVIYDADFIPRRMLNTVERLVTAARDMDQIRRGEDVFKLVLLVTCVETLQKLSGKSGSKKIYCFLSLRTIRVKMISDTFQNTLRMMTKRDLIKLKTPSNSLLEC